MKIDLAKPSMGAADLAAARSGLDTQLRWEKRLYRTVLTVLGIIALALGVARVGMWFDGGYWHYLSGAIAVLAGYVGLCIAADFRIGCLQMKRDALNPAEECTVLQALCEKHPRLAHYRQAVHATGRSLTVLESHAFWNWSRDEQEDRSLPAVEFKPLTNTATPWCMRRSGKRPPAC